MSFVFSPALVHVEEEQMGMSEDIAVNVLECLRRKKKGASEMRNWQHLCAGRRKEKKFAPPPFARVAGRRFLPANSSISFSSSVYTASLQPGHGEGPASVINALPRRHGGGCLSVVYFSFPVLLPDIFANVTRQ